MRPNDDASLKPWRRMTALNHHTHQLIVDEDPRPFRRCVTDERCASLAVLKATHEREDNESDESKKHERAHLVDGSKSCDHLVASCISSRARLRGLGSCVPTLRALFEHPLRWALPVPIGLPPHHRQLLQLCYTLIAPQSSLLLRIVRRSRSAPAGSTRWGAQVFAAAMSLRRLRDQLSISRVRRIGKRML